MIVDAQVKLTVQSCITCGCLFGFARDYDERLRDTHAGFFCPNGHSQSYLAKTEAERLRDELAREKHRTEQATAAAAYQRTMRETSEREAKRLRRRVSKGACPCCKRSFTDLRRHMATKHPNFGAVAKP